MTKKTTIMIATHDAGPSNILASLVKKYRQNYIWKVFVAGPAKEIFKNENKNNNLNRLGPSKIRSILSTVRPDLVLTGTGWGTDRESIFRQEAKKLNIKTAALLDHWTYYRQRFGSLENWKKKLPDFVFVGDKWAYKIALKNGFPKKRIFQVENPYLEQFIKGARKQKICKKSSGNDIKHILYISEPISLASAHDHNDPRFWGFNEYDVARDLLAAINSFAKPSQIKLKIRLHPSESKNKYSQRTNKIISVTGPEKSSLLNDLACADVVVGSTSMPLFIALLIGKQVISYIPSKKKVTLSLPQKEIKSISSFNDLVKAIAAPVANEPPLKTDYLIPKVSFDQLIRKFFIHATKQ